MKALRAILTILGTSLALGFAIVMADKLSAIPGVTLIIVIIVLVGGAIYAMNTIFFELHQKAIMSFILGIINCISWFFPYVGIPFSISGIVFSIQGKQSSRGKFSKPGLILNIVTLCLSLLMIVFNVLVTVPPVQRVV